MIRKKMYTHDIEVLDSIVKKYYMVDSRLVTQYDMLELYLKDYIFDKKGDVFKYETDHAGNPHLIKLGICSISYDVLKKKYNEMMNIFDQLIFDVMYLCREYAVGTFTKKLSREDIRDIAKMLLPRKAWKDPAFDECKDKIKKKYGIGSKEFSEALNLIQEHKEFCTYIGMEQKVGNISECELRGYVRLVMEMNGEDLYKKSVIRVVSRKTGMSRCGQTTYREIIKSEFEKKGKKLIEYEFGS